MAEYVIVLPTFGTMPFVVLGERAETSAGSNRRVLVVISWGLDRVATEPADASMMTQRFGMYLENANPEWKGVILNYLARHAGGPFELSVGQDKERALEAFHAINASWQMWFSGILAAGKFTDEQTEVLHEGFDPCALPSAA